MGLDIGDTMVYTSNDMKRLVVDPSDDFMDVQEAMHELKVGYATIYRKIKAGKLIAVKIGGHTLIPKSEIERVKKLEAMRR